MTAGPGGGARTAGAGSVAQVVEDAPRVVPDPTPAGDPVQDALQADLRAVVRGEVDFGVRRRAEYSADASIYRRVPLGVVFPRDADDVVAAVAACRRHGVPVTARGGGTSIAGQAVGPGVVLDCSRHLTRVLAVDPGGRTAVVEPGVVLDDLARALAPHGLAFGPDPSTHSRATIGGMIGNNACGAHSVAWGRTSDAVLSLDVLLYDGTRMTVRALTPDQVEEVVAGGGRAGEVHAALRDLARHHLAALRRELGRFPRQGSGYALEHLLPEHGFDVARALVGSEGTCALVLAATVRLVVPPAARALVVAGYPDPPAAADATPAVLAHRPLAVEGIDGALVDAWRTRHVAPAEVTLPPGRAWLYVEVGGATPAQARARADALGAALPGASGVRTITEPAEQRALWRIREEGSGLATRLPDGSEAWPGWEDAAVPVDRLGAYLRDFTALLGRHGRRGVVYGHYGEGCLHVRIDFDLATPAGVAGYRAFLEDAARLVASHGGSLSGEHGDGRARAELLPLLYSPEVVAAFEEFKAVWDPAGGLNPGVLVWADRTDAHLRVGPGSVAPRPERTWFAYATDGGDLARAVRRCVGVGACRAEHGPGVMCPSYQVTRDERDSTRGRARVLGEMLRGELVTDGWRAPEVLDALDLCLACKACRTDCPVNVDLATYKAEFLAHHYRRRLRPASHYSMGWLPVWARLGSAAPVLANALTARPLAGAVKRLAGIAPERTLPRLAQPTFRQWYARRPRVGGGRPVVLWADTFTEHFAAQVGRAATDVLARAGFAPLVPPAGRCCGLTWVSTGQLGVATRVLRRTLATLDPVVSRGVPVVVLEPSCAATLRDDLPALLPDDPRARRVAAAVRTLAELLVESGWEPPQLGVTALRQEHCHQHAVLGSTADEELLERAGVTLAPLAAGCCGLAGHFGFERAHYAVSMAVGERALLPAVRAAGPDTVVLADGFSCRTQVAQATGREAQHLAELLAAAPGPGRDA